VGLSFDEASDSLIVPERAVYRGLISAQEKIVLTLIQRKATEASSEQVQEEFMKMDIELSGVEDNDSNGA
jgi:predicted DNA-binding protein (UPF0251 family)